jgi:hypothetical protein
LEQMRDFIILLVADVLRDGFHITTDFSPRAFAFIYRGACTR